MNGQLRKGAYSLALDVLRIGTGHIKFDLEVVVPAHSSRTGLAWRIRVLSLGVDESTDSPTKPLKKSQYTSVRQRGAVFLLRLFSPSGMQRRALRMTPSSKSSCCDEAMGHSSVSNGASTGKPRSSTAGSRTF